MVLHSINTDGSKGESFCIDMWRWNPLRTYLYLCCHDIISEEEEDLFNGHLIDASKTQRIAIRLIHLLDQHMVNEYAAEFKKRKASWPDRECDICNGTGYRNYGGAREQCSGCLGQGVVRPSTRYSFTEETVKQFVGFLRCCDGFKVGVKIWPEAKNGGEI